MRPFLFVSLLTVLTAFSARADGLKAKADIALTDSVSFNYSFVEKPKVGDVIMKIKLSEPADSIQAFAEYDMPSMRGHHASGKIQTQPRGRLCFADSLCHARRLGNQADL